MDIRMIRKENQMDVIQELKKTREQIDLIIKVMESSGYYGNIKDVNVGEVFEYAGYEWLALDRDDGKLTAMMASPWSYTAFDEDNENNWEKSSLRKRLQEELLPELDVCHLCPHETDLTADNGDKTYGTCKDAVWILSRDEYRKYREIILDKYDFNDGWLWTCTPWRIDSSIGIGNYVRIINPAANISINDAGDNAGDSNGVVPACIFDLESF